jgi:hypothetical protein
MLTLWTEVEEEEAAETAAEAAAEMRAAAEALVRAAMVEVWAAEEVSPMAEKKKKVRIDAL